MKTAGVLNSKNLSLAYTEQRPESDSDKVILKLNRYFCREQLTPVVSSVSRGVPVAIRLPHRQEIRRSRSGTLGHVPWRGIQTSLGSNDFTNRT